MAVSWEDLIEAVDGKCDFFQVGKGCETETARGIARSDFVGTLWWERNVKEMLQCRQGMQQVVICDYVGSQQQGPAHASSGNDSSQEGRGQCAGSFANSMDEW